MQEIHQYEPARLAPGTRVVIRDEEWLIRSVDNTSDTGLMLTCDGERIRGDLRILEILQQKDEQANRNVSASLIDGRHLDSSDPKKISIATMHRAKGLEFDQVIVLAEPLAPLDGNWIAQTQRRLLYVAVTRAKRRTSIVWLP